MTDEPGTFYGHEPHMDAAADEVFLATADALARALRAGQLSALSDAIARYPRYAAALADYALYFCMVEMALPPLNADAPPAARLSPVARRALEHVPPARLSIHSILAEAQRQGMEPPMLAARVRLSADILARLEAGAIDPATIQAMLLDRLAQVLNCGHTAIRACLYRLASTGQISTIDPGLQVRESSAASLYRQESFAQAVRTSILLNPDDRAMWLQAIADEGLPRT